MKTAFYLVFIFKISIVFYWILPFFHENFKCTKTGLKIYKAPHICRCICKKRSPGFEIRNVRICGYMLQEIR